MRIPSGSTDRKIPFVAVDATDLKTRETGLTGFTVYRSRDGGTATAYTTPTVTEADNTNMPGLYWLTIDEDTTIGASHDVETYVLHITQASMAPVTLAIEIERVKFTEGQSATMANSAVDANAVQVGGTAQTPFDIGGQIGDLNDVLGDSLAYILDELKATDIAAAVWTNGTRTLTANPGLDAAGVRSAVGLASANLDTQLDALPTAAENATAVVGAAVDGATTLAESLRLSNSALGGKLSGAGTGTETVRDLADSKNRLVYTADSDGNRTAVTRDLT